jgi:predicted N-formylglutamate amidohydrolase
MKPTILFLSCEHATNAVPPNYRHVFHQHESLLETHRAIDLGSEAIIRQLSQTFGCEYITASVTRLLIDCNRSLSHATCFSEFSKSLSTAEKQQLIDKYYLPYRQKTEDMIKHHIDKGHQVLHLSIHTFTPILNGIPRNTGIGLLYDPKHHGEKEVVRQLHGILSQQTDYRIRLNYPYRGNTDSFTTYLRKRYPQTDYLGIELEVNQALVENKACLESVTQALSNSLSELLQLL